MQLSELRRNQIAGFLGIILIILTIAVAGAGYFTYKNLNEIVAKLETDNRPGNNLILYKEIMIALSGMENQVEFYQLMEEQEYLDNYNQYIDRVSRLLDSINQENQLDADLVTFNDSLASLIDRKTEILNELLQLQPTSAGRDLSDLEKKLERIPEIVRKSDSISDTLQAVGKNKKAVANATNDSESEDKTGWLKRLFSNKKKDKKDKTGDARSAENEGLYAENDESGVLSEETKDSLLALKAKQYRAELTNEIRKIKSTSENALKELKDKEMELETSHFDIQNQVIDLISFLESRESLKLELNSLNAKELASRTNRQILIFTTLTTILLLTSIFVMLSYFQKNKKYQDLLRESKKSAETLAKAKERFFANMSHEIRTPMNAISGFTRILLKSNLRPDQHEHVQIIHKSSDHLLRLLNDILDFSKLQAEKLQLEEIPFDLKELCTDTLKLLHESANSKGLQLTCEFANLPKAVLGDPYRLRQILLNLLNNGIKYTEKGQVTLLVNAKTSRGKSLITFKVSDTGPGIPKEQQTKLFREFEQANQSSFSKGTGLGLAITKRLVLLHDQGRIDLKSAEGKGTVVSFSLAYPMTDSIAGPADAVEFDQQINNLRILIADDEPFNIKLLATLLGRYAIDFDEACDGHQAHELLTSCEYDIILLDLKMPRMNGWEVIKSIREGNGPNKSKPFIALTATVTKLEQKKSQESGFDHIMRKPFDENTLFEVIAQQTKNILPKIETLPARPAVDLSSLYQMGDQEFVDDMVQTFITSATSSIESIEQHFRDHNLEQIAILAHRIVAPARHFKAEKLIKMLKELEKRAEMNDQTLTLAFITEIREELYLIFQSLRDSLGKEIAK